MTAVASTLRALASGLLAWRLIQALLFALVQAAPGGPAAALDLAWHSVLPVATLALQQTAYFATVVYAKARIELGQGYVRATRARGIAERRILWGHVARNVSPQLATAVLNRLGMLFTGAVLVETLFAWQGLASPLLDRLLQRLMDLSQIVPRFFLALLASAWLGPDWLALATILALTGWAALARQSAYFNAHPYLASVAIGALARAELDGELPERIERFRTACCGPLGSVGDRLVWAGWLPVCALLGLAAFGLGASPASVVLLFLGSYNAGQVALRVWGLRAGYRHGLHVAAVLGSPLLRQGPAHLARAAALLAGIGWPLVVRGVIGPARGVLVGVMAVAVIGAMALARLHGRVEGWSIAMVALAAFILYSVVR